MNEKKTKKQYNDRVRQVKYGGLTPLSAGQTVPTCWPTFNQHVGTV